MNLRDIARDIAIVNINGGGIAVLLPELAKVKL